MPRRIEQVNELLQSKLASLISREIPIENGLITISYVDCSPNFSHAKIGVSVLPFNLSNSVIEKLKRHSSLFASILKKETKFRKIPKFTWIIDDTEEEASKIDKLLNEIKVNT